MDHDPHNILPLLAEPARFSYSDVLGAGLADPRSLNTAELFAFGNHTHYVRHREQYLELPPNAVHKLQQLSVLSVLSANVGNWVAFSAFLSVVDPCATVDSLENLLMAMADAGHVQVKISEARQQVRVDDTRVLRDCYNGEKWALRVLAPADVADVDLGRARATLEKWLRDKIAPTRQELEG